jgi:hypothetical protein
MLISKWLRVMLAIVCSQDLALNDALECIGLNKPVGREFWFLERQPRGAEV